MNINEIIKKIKRKNLNSNVSCHQLALLFEKELKKLNLPYNEAIDILKEYIDYDLESDVGNPLILNLKPHPDWGQRLNEKIKRSNERMERKIDKFLKKLFTR